MSRDAALFGLPFYIDDSMAELLDTIDLDFLSDWKHLVISRRIVTSSILNSLLIFYMRIHDLIDGEDITITDTIRSVFKHNYLKYHDDVVEYPSYEWYSTLAKRGMSRLAIASQKSQETRPSPKGKMSLVALMVLGSMSRVPEDYFPPTEIATLYSSETVDECLAVHRQLLLGTISCLPESIKMLTYQDPDDDDNTDEEF